MLWNLALKTYPYARNSSFVLTYKPVLNLLLVTVFYRTRLRVFGLISTISTALVGSDAAMAALTLSSTPEMADLGAKILPTDEFSGLVN